MIPSRLSDFDLKGFTAYLADAGAVVLAPTNPYEVIRYRSFATVDSKPGGASQKSQVHIIYRKESGQLTYTGWSNKHYRDFQRGWGLGQAPPEKEKPKRSGRKPRWGSGAARAKRVAKIIERDGPNCWFCSLPLGDEPTLEHLIPKSESGGNGAHNVVLAHQPCNQMADNKPLVEKIELRAELTRKAEAGEYEP